VRCADTKNCNFIGNYINGWRFDKNGLLYEGDFVSYKEIYRGGFAFSDYHGTGRLTTPDGNHYNGEFNKGLYHGKGRLTFPNGDVLEGEFIDGKLHDYGKQTVMC